MDYYTDINSRAIDRWAEEGWVWSVPTTHEEFVRAQEGDWKVVLTPQKRVPDEWFRPFLRKGRLKDVRVLGLASGGGQQMPVFAALGADCTVVDYSDRQLENELLVAEREEYAIDIVKADMTKDLPFADDSFDIIFHPVSNCFVEDVSHVFRECFRMLRNGGVLLSGLDNGFNYLFEDDNEPLTVVNALPYNPLKDPALYKKCVEGDGALEFSHTMEEQIGGQLKAGFVLTDLFEDRVPDDTIGKYYPQFVATRAVKL